MARALPTMQPPAPAGPPNAPVASAQAATPLAARDALARTDIPVTGMTCAACARRVSNALVGPGGVQEAVVNAATGRASVWYDAATVAEDELLARIEGAGYGVVRAPTADARARDEAERTARLAELATLRHDALLALALALPVAIMGMAHGRVALFDTPAARWGQGLLTTLVLAWPGRRIVTGALAALRHRAPDMMVLVALGAGAAFVASWLALLAPALVLPPGTHVMPGMAPMAPLYFEAAAVIVAFVLLGRWAEGRARFSAADAITRVLALQPSTARVRRDDAWADVPLAEVRVGDVLLVRPGERIPVDATIASGSTTVDEALLTGESRPVARSTGDTVHAGAVNGLGVLELRATAVGDDSTAARIARLVQDAQGGRAPIARLADRVSAVFVPVVLVLAALTAAAWWTLSPVDARLANALQYGLAVLVVACPCALGLATPTALLVGTGRAASRGIVYRSGAALEAAASADTVVFDKTGTLTVGAPTLVAIEAFAPFTEATLLPLVSSAESVSEHPLGAAIVKATGARGLVTPPPHQVQVVPGHGIRATVAGRTVLVGSQRWLAAEGVDVAAGEPHARAFATQAATPVLVAVDGALAGVLAIADAPRDDAVDAVASLTARGVRVALLSGDDPVTARAVGAALGIADVEGGVRPEEKVARIAAREAAGQRVAMAGDGINDAAALARATVGLAMGSGSDLAIESAGVVLLRPTVAAVGEALSLARATRRTIRQNLAWAFGYNVLALPVAAGVLYPALGWRLSPMLASALMALSSIVVVLNALRLRRA
jgi:Cu+-exporting ATPase